MSDDEQQAEPAVWEPWQPRVGQRVRIRASAECPAQQVSPLPDGATGVVAAIDREGRDQGHVYRVKLDSPITPFPPYCAALELEPVDG